MIFLLDDRYPTLLPDPEQADENGMVTVSKTLGTERIIAAYKKGKQLVYIKRKKRHNYKGK